ncbi:MAG: DUF4337 domain-containing protein [Nitrospirae bacterium]|uniref:DUF4337 domain-containing protein n=1 Tax=Candidatus Magnetobacterium casense TaxID=1455061 RepID=UPI00058CBE42|nr:DUF4337 domain-containing protein [Candidatus Magnetobacterium casensis]MBF0336275.1 DUF4337 domain-containing protein [Nitrospirota bacterium]
MAEEKKEPWLNYLALSTVVLAVCATLSTFKGGGFSTLSVLTQSQASDQWAYYQAKSVKQYLYETQKERIEIDLSEKRQTLPDGLVQDYEKRITTYDQKIKKYIEEKNKIEKDARDLEAIRDNARSHSKAFGMAVIFLQVAILLSSISALLKKKPLWIAGMLVGSIGVFYFVRGWLMP